MRLEYGSGKLTLMMNGYDRPLIKNRAVELKTYEFKRSVPYQMATGKWQHFAVTWGKNGVALFVDGKKILSDSKTFKPAKHILKTQI